MANKYSRFQLKPYESQYVDPGSVQVTGVLRKRYDDNRASYDMLNRAAGSIKTLDGDRHIKESAINKVEGEFQRTIKVGNFENASRSVSDATNDFISNEGLQFAQQSYANRQSEIKVIDNLRAQGKQVLDFNEIRDTDPKSETFGQVVGHRTDTHSSYHQDPTSGKMVTDVYRPGSEMQLDYTKRMEILLQNIAKGGGSTVTKSDIAGYSKYLTTQGVSRGKAHRVVEAALDSYIDTNEGTQDYRRLTEIEGMSEQDAKLDMITRMQGVVENQIGQISKPTYMKAAAPTGGGGAQFNPKGFDYAGGTTISQGDVTDFTDIVRDLRDAEVKLTREPKGSINYKEAQEEIRVLKEKRREYTRQVLDQNPELKASMDKGRSMLGNHPELEDMFFKMTTSSDFMPGTPFARFSETMTSILGIDQQFQERNVSSIWNSDAGELKNMAELFEKEGAIEHINATHGTNYTKKDIPSIKAAATKYLKWMQEEGNKTSSAIDDMTVIAQADTIIFSPENAASLPKVNKALKQLDWESFDFVFETESERQEASDLWEARSKSEDGLNAEGKLDNIYFAGMTIPSLNHPSKLIIDLNGKRHVVNVKSADVNESLTSSILDIMGAPHFANTHEMSKRIQDGELTNAEVIQMLDADVQQRSGNSNVNFERGRNQNFILNSLCASLNMSRADFESLSDQQKNVHLQDWKSKQYIPN
tara:strand:- start:12561 stop:14666 length:2106 start_codon:yes stop_codon:yes gene_type:complete